ncbi:MAG: GNAT family N-acetyltransferase, partial [Kiritimatiellae bacterium]|nr:GNAT family N-acetyltransferase [Kiritimatiellia bacterium]
MEVRRLWSGTRAISLPFSDYCPPIVPKGGDVGIIIQELAEYGKSRHWRTIQLRGTENECRVPASCFFYGHRLWLGRSEAKLWAGLKGSVRTAIRKAEKNNVRVEASTTERAVREFCRLNDLTRRFHGLPPQPRRFFREIHAHVLSKGFGIIMLARYEERVIAAAVFLRFGECGLYKYGASDSGWQHLRANDLVMWAGIRWLQQNGCRRMTFGRTSPMNAGLRRFKMGWGAEEYLIPYIKYDLRLQTFIRKEAFPETGWHTCVFRVLPTFAARIFGELFYRYAA